MTTVKDFVPGVVGRLEINYSIVNHDRWALLLHPHPLYFGSMQNKVITSCARSASSAGYSWCAFNFRGVGNSEGEYIDLFAAYLDAAAVVKWLEKNFSKPAFAIGFSFGSYIAQQLAMLNAIENAVLIAPPFARLPYVDYDKQYECSIIQGTQDNIAKIDRTRFWLKSQSNKLNLYEIDGAGHFFHKKLNELESSVKTVMMHE